MKKLSSLSLFVALAGLALIPTADSFASYKDSCSGCEELRDIQNDVIVICQACKTKGALPGVPSFFPGANKGRTSVTCDSAKDVNNCDGKLKCGPCK